MKKNDRAPVGGGKAQDDKGAGVQPDELLDFKGVGALVQLGLQNADERRSKNRIILFLCISLACSLSWNAIQSLNQPEPKLLGETPDGRIRPLPLLSDPIFTHKEVLGWAERCVQKLYRLSYVDWRTTLQNESLCLSDKSREGFANSLKKIGVLQYLSPENQGTVYAVPNTAVMRATRMAKNGYQEWVVDVPYRIVVDGRQRGSLEVVMSMRIRRVSLTWREDGIWVDEYVVKSRSAGQK